MERKHPAADVGVVIGRFQVEDLHAGHIELLDWVVREHSKVVVMLGVPAIHGKRNNPLDFHARALMLHKYNRGLIVVPLEDQKYDEVWSRNLDTMVHSLLLPCQTACLYGARDSFLSHYKGKYPTQELMGDAGHIEWSGTSQREKLRLPVRTSADWRAGVIWASQNQWPRVDACVDIAIFNAAKEMLLGRKPNEDKFRFIGGFADPKSLSFEADAYREVFEETGLALTDIVYVGSTVIDDWRYKVGPDKIKTLLFKATAPCLPQAIAADDICEVRWFATEKFAAKDILVDTHLVLADLLEQKGFIKCFQTI